MRVPLAGFLLIAAALPLAGCLSRPVPPYRVVDAESPEFRAAVDRETAVALGEGKSAREARTLAIQRVTKRTVAANQQHRTAQVAPLVAALEDLARPRGCWAFTVTTTRRESGRTIVTVEQFDPFQPEARIWTLVSRDGRPPTESEQSDYRRQRVESWKTSQRRTEQRAPAAERVGRSALYAELETSRTSPDGPRTVAFTRAGARVAAVGGLPPSRESYELAPDADRVLSHRRPALEPLVLLGGSLVVEHSSVATHYRVVDPAVPPFPATSVLACRIRSAGTDRGDVVVETVWSDHRRVTCHEDRFEVRIGVPSVQDFLPATP